MPDMLLTIGFIALFAYGYWVMARLDHYIFNGGGLTSLRRRLSAGRTYNRPHSRY